MFSIAGLVSAALATRYVLPMLAPDGATGMGMRRYMAQLAGALVRGLPRLRWPLAALGVAALALVLWQGGHLWRADLGAMSPVPKSAQQLDEMLRNDIGASDGGVLVVAYGDDEQAALRNTEAAAAKLDALVDTAELGGHLVQEAGERLLRGDVQRKAEAAVGLRGLLRQLGVEVTDGDLRTCCGERLRGGLADPACAAGDRDDLALERSHVRCPSVPCGALL